MSREAMKQALEALEQVRDANIQGLTLTPNFFETIESLRAALDASEPEPMAWYVRFDTGRVNVLASPVSKFRRILWESAGKRFTVTPLYTAPVAFFCLTTQEILDIVDDHTEITDGLPMLYRDQAADLARAIEAKLKEKNAA